MPNAPPTSGAMQRTLCSGMPVTNAVSSSRWMCGVWLDIQTVYSSVPGLYQPMSPRVSIGFGMRRWLTMPLADDDLGAVDRGVRAGLVADRPLEHDVVRGVLVELRRAGLGRLLGIDDRGQRLPVDGGSPRWRPTPGLGSRPRPRRRLRRST